MGTPLNDQTKEELFTLVKHRLGAPIRKIELDWDQMCSLLETSIEDYAQRVQDWLIENQWSSLLGNDVDNLDKALLTSPIAEIEVVFVSILFCMEFSCGVFSASTKESTIWVMFKPLPP